MGYCARHGGLQTSFAVVQTESHLERHRAGPRAPASGRNVLGSPARGCRTQGILLLPPEPGPEHAVGKGSHAGAAGRGGHSPGILPNVPFPGLPCGSDQTVHTDLSPSVHPYLPC